MKTAATDQMEFTEPTDVVAARREMNRRLTTTPGLGRTATLATYS